MTDLLQVLPDFDQKPYTHLLPSLDKALITTNDLLTLDAADVAKRAQVPAGELRKLADGVVAALHRQLGFGGLMPNIGAGKTQLLLTLLLSAQLAPPAGLSKSSVYISTEALLSTTRLSQLLSSHPVLSALPAPQKPSLSRILSIQTPDLESQDHILRYQLPVAIRKHNIGLVIIDSVAANYRAEFEKQGPNHGGAAASMAKRGTQLVQLVGAASTTTSNTASRTTSTNSQPHSQNNENGSTSQPTHKPDLALTLSPDPLSLDHQQRWFTGWGDSQYEQLHVQKTPSLGLVWTNQLACRIALKKQPVFASSTRPLIHTVNGQDQWNDGEEDWSNHVLRKYTIQKQTEKKEEEEIENVPFSFDYTL
ncbi:hypothetical protein CFE70_007663 [Pyrenophora teres f. teres 0-1]